MDRIRIFYAGCALLIVLFTVGIVSAQDENHREGIRITIETAAGPSEDSDEEQPEVVEELIPILAVIPPNWIQPEAIARYEIHIRAEELPVETCDYSPSGTWFRVQVNLDVDIIDLTTGNEIASQIFEGQEPAPCPRFIMGEGGKTTYGIPDETTFYFWMLAMLPTHELPPIGPMLSGHHASIRELAFSPDGESIFTRDDDGTIIIWDAQTGTMQSSLSVSDSLSSSRTQFTPDGQYLVAVEDNEVSVIEMPTGDLLWKNDSDARIDQLVVSPGTAYIAVIDANDWVTVWSITPGEKILAIEMVGANSINFDPDETTLAISYDRFVRLWALPAAAP